MLWETSSMDFCSLVSPHGRKPKMARNKPILESTCNRLAIVWVLSTLMSFCLWGTFLQIIRAHPYQDWGSFSQKELVWSSFFSSFLLCPLPFLAHFSTSLRGKKLVVLLCISVSIFWGSQPKKVLHNLIKKEITISKFKVWSLSGLIFRTVTL